VETAMIDPPSQARKGRLAIETAAARDRAARGFHALKPAK